MLAAAAPAAAGPERASGNSAADITLDECVVESSKDISYIGFLVDGEETDKDESIDGDTFDLTQVGGIDDVDAIEVKSSTTVETFDINCSSDDADDSQTQA